MYSRLKLFYSTSKIIKPVIISHNKQIFVKDFKTCMHKSLQGNLANPYLLNLIECSGFDNKGLIFGFMLGAGHTIDATLLHITFPVVQKISIKVHNKFLPVPVQDDIQLYNATKLALKFSIPAGAAAFASHMSVNFFPGVGLIGSAALPAIIYSANHYNEKLTHKYFPELSAIEDDSWTNNLPANISDLASNYVDSEATSEHETKLRL